MKVTEIFHFIIGGFDGGVITCLNPDMVAIG